MKTFHRICCVLVFLAVAVTTALWHRSAARAESAPASAPNSALRRVKVLWLGDRNHHQPLQRCRQAFPPLARAGIDLTYTENVADLNGPTLGRYDCLLLYANIEKIEPQQEQALIDYVEAGHGFVPVHCASFCFLNSPRITALMGGRFKSHSTGVFEETIVKPDHPIEKGLRPIKSWDETYVHEMHNDQGREVLGYRVEGDKKEPYTWTRTQGKGRVFYTAWGHDARTWGNPDFQSLLVHGIRWAAGDWAMDAQPLPAAPQTHVDAPIPNYLPGEKWGSEGEQIHTMQEPLKPDQSMAHMVLPPGFAARLYASEPDIYRPICMAFDARGRLWLGETVDYPNELQRSGEGHDRIVICEDTKGTGVADKFTVFADKLSIPTSMCFANGGVIVSQAPDMLFLKSSKNDDHADVRTVMFTGFGTRDTHAGPSNLRWGFDNWIYGTIGYSGFRGKVGGQDVSFGQGIFRMKPDGSRLEFLASTTNNTWGLGLTEDNQIFASTANANASCYLHIPNRYYEQVKGWTVKRLETTADTSGIFPVTEKVRQMDNHARYTAGAGHAIYTARAFPREYWNRIAFVAEPTAHLLGQFILEPHGSGFISRNDFNLLASDDEWTAPITGEIGPDGAVWMSDWYNFIVQHNPIPKGFEGGKGGAYVTPLRDKTHGRIYRIVYGGSASTAILDLTKMSAAQLVQMLRHDNMLWRMHSQRLLVEQGDRSIIGNLIELVNDPSVDAIGLNPSAIHALWTLHGLGAFGDQPDSKAVASAVGALKHPSAGVRKAALDVLPRNQESIEPILAAKSLEDPDAQVRKSALLALSEMPAAEPAGERVFAILSRKENAADNGLADAAAIAGAHHDAGFLKALFASKSAAPAEGAQGKVVQAVVNQYAQRGPADSIVATLSAARGSDPAVATLVLESLVAGWPRTAAPNLSDADIAQLRSTMQGLPAEARDRLLALAERWGRRDLFAEQFASAMKDLQAAVADTNLDASQRGSAARKLLSIDDSDAALTGILNQVSPRTTPDVQAALISALSESRNPVLGGMLMSRWDKLTPTSRVRVINVLVNREPWASALLDSVKTGAVGPGDLLPQQWQALMSYPSEKISGRARALRAAGRPVNSDRKALVDKAMPLLQQQGDAAKGQQVFEKNCLVCHTIEGKGGKVGPDLTGIGARPKSDNLIQLLDPNRNVEGTYKQWTARTNDDVISGRLYSESKTSIEIIDATGQIHSLQRDQIRALKASEQGVMPEGFEQLPPEDIVNVLEYLNTSKVKH